MYCCWCAQDLVESNRFYESMGFVPIVYRAGSAKKKWVHIFWQRRIRSGDVTTPWWFPSETRGGLIDASRIALPILPGMIGLCLLAARRPAAQGGRWIIVIGVVGASLMWASHPLVFLLAPISLGMLYQFRREPGFVRRWTLANAMLAASFSLLYFVNISVQRDPFLDAFWIDNGGFPQSYRPVPLFLWLTDVCVDVLAYPIRPLSLGLIPPMIIGVIAICRRQEWAIMGALVAPLVLMLLAGLTRVYPFQGTRLIIFLIPVMFLLSIYGAEALRIECRRRPLRWFGWIPLAATALAGFVFSIEHVRNPQFEQQLWPALKQLGKEQPAIPVVTQEPADNAIVALYRPNWITVSAWPRMGRPLPDLPHYFLIISTRVVDKNGKQDYQIYYKHPIDRPGYVTRYDWSILTEAGAVIGYEKLPTAESTETASKTVSLDPPFELQKYKADVLPDGPEGRPARVARRIRINMLGVQDDLSEMRRGDEDSHRRQTQNRSLHRLRRTLLRPTRARAHRRIEGRSRRA